MFFNIYKHLLTLNKNTKTNEGQMNLLVNILFFCYIILSLNGSFPFTYLWLVCVGGSGGGRRWTIVVDGQVVVMKGLRKNYYYIRLRREK